MLISFENTIAALYQPLPGKGMQALFALLIIPTLSPAIYSAEWSIRPILDVQEVYTNNVFLTPKSIREDDLISIITPGLSVSGTGNRVDMQFDYSLQNLLYINNSSRNNSFNILQTNIDTEIIKEKFFLDLNLNRSTQNVGNNNNNGFDNLNLAGNRENVLTYSITPYWRQRIGGLADVDFSYKRDQVDAKTIDSSNSDVINLLVASGDDFHRLLWNLSFRNNKVNNSRANSTRTTEFKADFKYLLSRKFALVADVGYDMNRFETSRDSIDNELWRVGAEWNPSTRTSLKLMYGQRFFGDDFLFQTSHRTRKLETRISLEKIPAATRDLLFEQQAFGLTDVVNNPIEDLSTRDILNIDVNASAQTNEILIRTRFNTALIYRLKKHVVSLLSTYEELNYELSRDTEYERNINLGWQTILSEKSSVQLTLSWNKSNRRNDIDDKYLLTELKLVHQLSALMNVQLGLRYVDRDSNEPRFVYKENRVFANIVRRFN